MGFPIFRNNIFINDTELERVYFLNGRLIDHLIKSTVSIYDPVTLLLIYLVKHSFSTISIVKNALLSFSKGK